MIKLDILDKYILAEMLKILAGGVVLIAGVFFATTEFQNVLRLISDIGIEPATALSITILQLPNTFVFCLPAGIILASCLIILKMSQERNLVAVTLSGNHQAKVLLPIFAFALVGSVLSFIMSDELVPHCRQTATKLLLAGALASELPVCRNSATIFQKDENNRTNLMLVGHYLKRTLENVVIFDLTNKETMRVTWAKEGQWKRGRWQLDGGHIYDLKPRGNSLVQSFTRMEVDGIGKLIDKFEKQGPLPTDQSTSELKAEIDKLQSEGKTPPPATMLRYFRRFSQPASCLLVVFISMPLLSVAGRRWGFKGLAYSGVSIALYFFIQQVTLAMGDFGAMPPLLAAWFPGLVAMIPGIAWLISEYRAYPEISFAPRKKLSKAYLP